VHENKMNFCSGGAMLISLEAYIVQNGIPTEPVPSGA